MIDFSEYVAVDIETTGLDPKIDEIIEIGAVRFKDFEPVDTFSGLINPKMSISEFITKLTGITNEMIEEGGGDDIQVTSEFADFLGDSVPVFHNASFDTSFLEKFLPDINRSYLDTKVIARVLYPFRKSVGLSTLTQLFGITNVQPHRGVSDATATGEVLAYLAAARNHLPVLLTDKIKMFCSYWGNDAMRDFFGAGIINVDRELKDSHIPPRKIPPSQKLNGKHKGELWQGDIKAFFDTNGELSRDLDRFEYRDGQAEMASDCLDSLQGGAFIIAEAGTGTGKSFSYLLPALISSTEGKKAFVSTRTKNLQKQLFEKDLPFMLKYFPVQLKASLLKGRANYLCLLKLHNFAMASGLISPQDVPRVLHLLSFAEFSKTGDFSEIQHEKGRGFDYISRLFSSADGFCTGQKCQFVNKCFLFKARKEARSSDIVVVNHHLFFADLSSETDILSEFSIGVFDEAHHLDSTAREYLGMEFSPYEVNSILERISGSDERKGDTISALFFQIKKSLLLERDIDRYQEQIGTIQNECKSISRSMRNFFESAAIQAVKEEGKRRTGRNSGGIKLRYKYGDKFQAHIQQSGEALIEDLERLSSNIKKLLDNVRRDFTEDHVEAGLIDLLETEVRNLDSLCLNLSELMLAENNDWVYWYEAGARRSQINLLKSAPINAGKHIHEAVLSNQEALVFTSATLKSTEGFDSTRFKLGLDLVDDDRVIERSYPSPFQYQNLLRVLILEFLPPPDSSNFSFQASEIITIFAQALRKNMMALTTSYMQLESLYELSKARLEEDNYTVLAQSIDGNAEEVANKFNQVHPGLLIGTDSFWEGVDFPGEKLEILFVCRLPFAVPTEPITAAMGEYFQSQGKDPFRSFSLPEAVIKFRQGCGRLIRSNTDKGVIVILDNRISTKFYGKAFIDALPVRPIVIKQAQQLESILYRTAYETG
ncbi:MAG: hypothetical protein GF315_00460 [candidate division Zixibacteria bacterium]|nr:hypothetical protein [candidate division Zixibacteria bacterium]